MFAFQSGIRPSAPLAIGVAALIPFSLLLSGCEQHAAENKVLAQEASPPRDSFPNDTALFLAGLKGRPDGPYHDLEQTDAWKKLRRPFRPDLGSWGFRPDLGSWGSGRVFPVWAAEDLSRR